MSCSFPGPASGPTPVKSSFLPWVFTAGILITAKCCYRPPHLNVLRLANQLKPWIPQSTVLLLKLWPSLSAWHIAALFGML